MLRRRQKSACARACFVPRRGGTVWRPPCFLLDVNRDSPPKAISAALLLNMVQDGPERRRQQCACARAFSGPSWNILGHFGLSWSQLGAILGPLRAILWHLVAILGPSMLSWCQLGAILDYLWVYYVTHKKKCQFSLGILMIFCAHPDPLLGPHRATPARRGSTNARAHAHSWRFLVACWGHLGANLALSWAIFGFITSLISRILNFPLGI